MAIPDWLNAPTTARIAGHGLQAIKSPADAYVERIENEPSLGTQLYLAKRALRHYPGCIDAHLRKAVDTGDSLWCPVAAREDDFSWWGVSATRPDMRALASLAVEYADWGDETGAYALHSRLLGMNPNDNQGIRHLMQDATDEPFAPRMQANSDTSVLTGRVSPLKIR